MTNACMQLLAWSLGAWEIVVLLLLALMLFGGKRLPEVARGLAGAIREFKRELTGAQKDIDDSLDTHVGSKDKTA